MAQAEVLPIDINAEDKSKSAFDSLRKNIKDSVSVINALQSQISALGGGNGIGGIGSLATKMKGLAIPAAIIVAIGSAAVMAKRWNDELVNVDKAAGDLGRRASEIDQLGKLMRKFGGDAKDAVPALQTLKEATDQMALGDRVQSLKDLFELNGKSVTDAAGNVRSLEDAFRDVSSLIINATSQADRLHVATLAFGQEAAPAMVKAIMNGVTSLDALKKNDAFDALAKKAHEFDDLVNKIRASTVGWVDSMTDRIKANLMPAMQWIYDKLGAIWGVGSSEPQAGTSGAPLRITVNALPGAAAPATKTRKLPDQEDDQSAYDREVNSINKRTAAMRADTLAVGQNEEVQARLRAEFGLLQAAQRDGSVTDQQIEKYTQLRAQMSATQALQGAGITLSQGQASAFDTVTNATARVAGALDTAKREFESINQALKFGGDILVDAFDKIGDKATSMSDIVQSALGKLKRAALDAFFTGSGPLAGLFGMKSTVQGGTGGVLGALFGGFRAGGGDVEAGKAYRVNEQNSSSEWFVPQVSGTVLPNNGRGGGAPSFQITQQIDARDSDPNVEARIMARLPAIVNKAVVAAVVAVQTGRRNDPSFFAG
jgi:hypothetical protein